MQDRRSIDKGEKRWYHKVLVDNKQKRTPLWGDEGMKLGSHDSLRLQTDILCANQNDKATTDAQLLANDDPAITPDGQWSLKLDEEKKNIALPATGDPEFGFEGDPPAIPNTSGYASIVLGKKCLR